MSGEQPYCLSEIRALVQWLRERGVDPQTAISLFKAEVLRDELTARRRESMRA